MYQDLSVQLQAGGKLGNLKNLFWSLLVTVVLATSPQGAEAQEQLLRKGDAVVTGYSGVALLKPAPNSKPVDFAIINQQGAVLQVFDLSQMDGGSDARLVNAPRKLSITAQQIGQVFGVTLDDGKDAPGPAKVPNIYATATSVFGLQLVQTANGVRNRAKIGGPNRSWMDGQFGASLGGGPGSIYKIDGLTGEATLFANVQLNGVPNSGPGLGNIAFDPKGRKLYVSDLQTGMIHSFDLQGNEIAQYDHGIAGRQQLGLPPVAYDPASRVEITSPSFNALDPATWGYAAPERQVWGVGVRNGRLYYSVSEGPEIWSVGIRSNGTFAPDAQPEIEVRAPNKDAVSDITFSGNGTMYLSQRGKGTSSYDYTTMAQPQTAAVMRYRQRKLANGLFEWLPAPEEYAIGFAAGFRNTNGGTALGYGYDRFGTMSLNACERMLWSTGELLRENAQHKAKLEPGGATIVHGLQGNDSGLVRPGNEAPFQTYFVDFDNHHQDPASHGHMGDVAIWSTCPGGRTASDTPPAPPAGPRLKLTKSCSAAAFGDQMRCRVSVRSTGSEAPQGPVSITDVAELLQGPGGASPLILSATPDDPEWRCSPVPADNFNCVIPGDVMVPGRRRSIEVVMDLTGLTTPTWSLRNCATLDGTNQKKCVTRNESDGLTVTKTGPSQATCIANGPCDFQVSVQNNGKRTFDGNLFFGDNLTIGGAAVGGITVDNIAPSHGCVINSASLPAEWECHVTIPPGGQKSFDIWLTIPTGAVQPNDTQGRNCFVATDPSLAFTNGGALPANFWQNVLDPANTGNGLGTSCVDFSVQPEQPNQNIPPRVIKGLPQGPPGLPGDVATMELTIRGVPDFFSGAGELITFIYEIKNTGNVDILTYTLNDPMVTPAGCDLPNLIPVGQTATCKGTYRTTAADVGNNIITTATVTGTW